jgi:hypothetical protein
MSTKNNPGKFNCYEKAEPDEPMFVLLGRDPVASFVVRYWAVLRAATGENLNSDEQITKALQDADAMEAWARKFGKEGRVDSALVEDKAIMEMGGT